jgi:hypothetical protein
MAEAKLAPRGSITRLCAIPFGERRSSSQPIGQIDRLRADRYLAGVEGKSDS